MEKGTDEEWRDVVGYEGIYQVSDQGRVRSLDRYVVDARGRRRFIRGLLRKPGVSTYPYVYLQGGKLRTLHALVAEAFIGPRPDGMEARHLNGDHLDARLANLAYGTHKENGEDMTVHGTSPAFSTHCRKGHEYTPENTGHGKRGEKSFRRCLTCRKQWY